MTSKLKVNLINDGGDNNLITSNGSGVLTASKFKILQVVENSSSTNFTNSSTSMSELLNASITPSSTSNKILIHFHTNCQVVAGSNAYGRATVFRGTTSGTDLGALIGGSAAGSNANFPLTGTYLDSPSTTSATTYKTQGVDAFGSGHKVQHDSIKSTITLMEVLA